MKYFADALPLPRPAFFEAPPAGTRRWLPYLKAYRGIPGRRLGEDEAEPLGRIGALSVRLAASSGEIRRAQRLRYRVFYEEMAAIPSAAGRLARRDVDRFDAICDHLLVIDDDAPDGAEIIGTYRLLRQSVAAAHGGFYTDDEFATPALVARHPEIDFLELGRSCVLPAYRNKRTVELLWHGIWTYVLRHGIGAMFGCASFAGTDPEALALPLSFLHHHARAEGAWRVAARPERAVTMNRRPAEGLDTRRALAAMPPLLKGYLRLGARIGEGAVVDHRFGTTDVLVVMPVAALSERYVAHFGAEAGRHAA